MNKNGCPFQEVVIFGGNGSVGSLFGAKLESAGCRVTAIDLDPDPVGDLRCTTYIYGDVRNLGSEARQALTAANLVVIALPETVAVGHSKAILSSVSPGALVVDTLSVKSAICEVARTAPGNVEYLSVNPMFAPAAGFAGNNVVMVAISPGSGAKKFQKLIESWGSRVTELTAEQHDRLTATVQVATHAAILAFGLTLQRLGYDSKQAASVTTPPHSAMLKLLERIAKGAPEVYWDIQAGHPHAAEVRSVMLDCLNDLSRIVENGDSAGFRLRLADLLPLTGESQKSTGNSTVQ